MAKVNYVRKELKEALKRYVIIRDCLKGEQQIKSKTTVYLPVPSSEEDSNVSSPRYAAYLLRAVFYNVTKRTLNGLCGQIFSRNPVIEVPDEMQLVVDNADGSGVDLTQLAKAAAEHVLGCGRAGLFVDYPTTDGDITKADLARGDIRPTLTLYAPEKIINWRTTTRGALTLLSLVVLEETYIAEDDGFEAVERKQWRVLRLTGDVYTVQVYKLESSGSHKSGGVVVPTDSSGNAFNEIPFSFIGALNNDSVVDEPPMYDIASLNIAHYRNSADYEESTFMVGQPTPVFTGLTEDWVTNVLKGKVMLGARGAVSLPTGGDAKLLQAESNTMPYEAMQHKEKQMVALGAKVVEQRAVVRTATEAGFDESTETSVLASTAKNISAAFTWGLQKAAKFQGVTDAKISFALNTDFDLAAMSPEARRQLLAEWQAGLLAWEEARGSLRKSGIATLKDAEARDIIDEELSDIPVVTAKTGNSDGNAK